MTITGWLRARAVELRFLLGFLIVAASFLVFGQIAEEVFEGDASAFDRTLLLAFRSARDLADPIGPPWLESAAQDVTALGGFTVLALLVGSITGYLAIVGRRLAVLWLLGSVLGGGILSSGFKAFFERPRPDLVPHKVAVFTSSFPSGHATLSAVTYLTLGVMLAKFENDRRAKIYCLTVAACLTILVGVSRIYLGVHYPTDVLAGWCLGGAWAGLCWIIAMRVIPGGNNRPQDTNPTVAGDTDGANTRQTVVQK